MPDGELRRPPQLWEQRLARTTSVLAAGVSNGDATSIVSPTPPPGSDIGVEPAPVLPPPGDFVAPSTPTLISSVQGINVVWNGLNSAGDLWPSDTSYVEVHMDTSGPTFTVGTATLKGRLARPGGLAVTGLSRGTTYYFRLRGADAAGNVTAAGTAASAQPGQINAPDIAANAITANSIVAGTITGWSINSAYLSGGTISGGYITGGTLNAGYISGGTVTGASVTTSAFNPRVALNDGGGRAAYLDIYSSNNAQHSIYGDLGDLIISPSSRLKVGTSVQIQGDLSFVGSGNGDITATSLSTTGTLDVDGSADFATTTLIGSSGAQRAFRVGSDGGVFSYGVDDNTTASAANVRVGASAQLLRSTSTVRLKDELAPLADDLADVPADKIAAFPASVDPYDVLTVTPTEFRSLSPADGDARSLGFIAEDVAAKLPWAANWDDSGLPSAVEDRPILAALLWVVRDQQATITDLRSRIEALEA